VAGSKIAENARRPFFDEGDSLMSATIEFTCPACETVLVFSASLSGTKVSCPNCQNVAVIASRPLDVVAKPESKGASSNNRAELVASIENSGQQSREGARFCCPFCQSNLAPKVKRKISTAGWLTFSLLLIFCFPLCIIGLFIKDQYHVCRSCGVRLD
jgi:DNA-directed RNA polymerase subunit M/transcription elongation factor TFIIS